MNPGPLCLSCTQTKSTKLLPSLAHTHAFLLWSRQYAVNFTLSACAVCVSPDAKARGDEMSELTYEFENEHVMSIRSSSMARAGLWWEMATTKCQARQPFSFQSE